MNTHEESMAMQRREPLEDAKKHEFEKYPYGSVKRLFAAFLELTGIDVLKKEEGK
jgi:hypothetical protein